MVGLWFEPGFEPIGAPGFIPALDEAVEAYRSFVGAEKVAWRTRAGRSIGAALRGASAA